MIIDHQSDVIGNDQNLTEVESRTVECEKGVVGSCYAGEVTMPNKERKKKILAPRQCDIALPTWDYRQQYY
jgi:hypothetical protein